RRHTIFSRVWSADVCSSELLGVGQCLEYRNSVAQLGKALFQTTQLQCIDIVTRQVVPIVQRIAGKHRWVIEQQIGSGVESELFEIGRASGRERVTVAGVRGT